MISVSWPTASRAKLRLLLARRREFQFPVDFTWSYVSRMCRRLGIFFHDRRVRSETKHHSVCVNKRPRYNLSSFSGLKGELANWKSLIRQIYETMFRNSSHWLFISRGYENVAIDFYQRLKSRLCWEFRHIKQAQTYLEKSWNETMTENQALSL